MSFAVLYLGMAIGVLAMENWLWWFDSGEVLDD